LVAIGKVFRLVVTPAVALASVECGPGHLERQWQYLVGIKIWVVPLWVERPAQTWKTGKAQLAATQPVEVLQCQQLVVDQVTALALHGPHQGRVQQERPLGGR